MKIKDDYIWAGTDYDLFSKMDNNPFVKKRGIWIGIMLLTFGIYLIVNNVLHNVALNYDIEWLMVFTNLIIRYLPSIFISILSIAVGIKFIIKK